MTGDQELQLIASILASGDPHTPRRVGVEPEALTNLNAQRALALIYEYASKELTLGKVPSAAYLQEHGIPEWFIYTPAVGTVEQLSMAAKTAYLRRLMLAATGEANALLLNDPVQAHARLHELLADPKLVALTSEGSMQTSVTGFRAAMQRYNDSKHLAGVVGQPTPFEPFTTALKGWRKGGLYPIYAPPKNLKTTLAMKCAHYLFEQNKRVAIFTTEMTRDQLFDMLLCMHFRLNADAFASRTLATPIYNDIMDDLDYFEARVKDAIHIYRPGAVGLRAIVEIEAEVRKLNQDGGLALVIIDGHYRLAGDRDWVLVYNITQATKRMALELDLPVILTTQEGSEKGEVGYQAYEQEADCLIHANLHPNGMLVVNTKAIRQGRSCWMHLQPRFDRMDFDFKAFGYDN